MVVAEGNTLAIGCLVQEGQLAQAQLSARSLCLAMTEAEREQHSAGTQFPCRFGETRFQALRDDPPPTDSDSLDEAAKED